MAKRMEDHLGVEDVIAQAILSPANTPLSLPRSYFHQLLDLMLTAAIVRVLLKNCLQLFEGSQQLYVSLGDFSEFAFKGRGCDNSELTVHPRDSLLGSGGCAAQFGEEFPGIARLPAAVFALALADLLF
jgi:hypothetical protein